MAKKKQRRLRTAAAKLSDDYHKLQKAHWLARDPAFLEKIAEHIRLLKEAAEAEGEAPKAKMVVRYLTTPWGAPRHGTTSLYEAAVEFELEDRSDLEKLASHLAKEAEEENRYIYLLRMIEKRLHNERD
jgi:uncharacterized protein YigA (DUF484 family)